MAEVNNRFCGVQLYDVPYITKPLVNAYNDYIQCSKESIGWQKAVTYLKAGLAYPLLTLLFYTTFPLIKFFSNEYLVTKTGNDLYNACQNLRRYKFSKSNSCCYFRLRFHMQGKSEYMARFTIDEKNKNPLSNQLNVFESECYKKIPKKDYCSFCELNVSLDVFHRLNTEKYGYESFNYKFSENGTKKTNIDFLQEPQSGMSLAELTERFNPSIGLFALSKEDMDILSKLELLNAPYVHTVLANPMLSVFKKPAEIKETSAAKAKLYLTYAYDDIFSRDYELPNNSNVYFDCIVNDNIHHQVMLIQNDSEAERKNILKNTLKQVKEEAESKYLNDELKEFKVSLHAIIVSQNKGDDTYAVSGLAKWYDQDRSSGDGPVSNNGVPSLNVDQYLVDSFELDYDFRKQLLKF